MAFDLSQLSSDIVQRPPRIIVTGVPKIGKTSFACGSRCDESGMPVQFGINSPAVIPIKGEEGCDDIPVLKFPVVTGFEQLMDYLRSLYSQESKIRTVVIDSVSTLEPLIWSEICNEYDTESIEQVGGGYGKGYTRSLEYWDKILFALDHLRNDRGMTIVLISHVKVKVVTNPALSSSYDSYVMSCNEKLAAKLMQWADVTTFAMSKVIVRTEALGFGKEEKRAVDDGGRRYLYTRENPAYPSGGRGIYGWLPSELPLDWASFENAVKSVNGEKGE